MKIRTSCRDEQRGQRVEAHAARLAEFGKNRPQATAPDANFIFLYMRDTFLYVTAF